MRIGNTLSVNIVYSRSWNNHLSSNNTDWTTSSWQCFHGYSLHPLCGDNLLPFYKYMLKKTKCQESKHVLWTQLEEGWTSRFRKTRNYRRVAEIDEILMLNFHGPLWTCTSMDKDPEKRLILTSTSLLPSSDQPLAQTSWESQTLTCLLQSLKKTTNRTLPYLKPLTAPGQWLQAPLWRFQKIDEDFRHKP